MMTEPTTRTCKKCGVEKALAEFSPKGRYCHQCNHPEWFNEDGSVKEERLREQRWSEVKAAAKAQKKADKARQLAGIETPWRERFQVHPAADLFPMMSDAELDDLAADILANGLRSRIVTWGQPVCVLDGRNRLEAMERAGLYPATAPTSPGLSVIHLGEHVDPVAYVMSANLKRRHLTAKQRRNLVAELLKLAPERSDRSVAKDAGVSHPTVAKVRSELKDTDDVEIISTSTRIDRHGHRRPSTQKPRPKAAKAKAAVGGLSVKDVVEQMTNEWRAHFVSLRNLLSSLKPGDLPDSEVSRLRNTVLENFPEEANDVDDMFSLLIVEPNRRPTIWKSPTPLEQFEDNERRLALTLEHLVNFDLTKVAVTREHVATLVADSIVLEHVIDSRLDKAVGDGRPYLEIIGELQDPGPCLVCDDCGASVHKSDIGGSLYECGDCGTRYTRESSADGDSNRCPECNKFGAKVADYGCPECGAGELVDQADDEAVEEVLPVLEADDVIVEGEIEDAEYTEEDEQI